MHKYLHTHVDTHIPVYMDTHTQIHIYAQSSINCWFILSDVTLIIMILIVFAIALTVDGIRRFNTNFRPSWRSTFRTAASDWTYKRTKRSEKLQTDGPLIKDCTLEVLLYGRTNVQFSYSYTHPSTRPATRPPTRPST